MMYRTLFSLYSKKKYLEDFPTSVCFCLNTIKRPIKYVVDVLLRIGIHTFAGWATKLLTKSRGCINLEELYESQNCNFY